METSVDQHYLWGLSGPALVLYVVAVALFLTIVGANLRVIEALTEGNKAKKPSVAASFTLFITFVSNFIGAATIALLAKTSGTPARMSMMAAPLILALERHMRAAFKDPKDRNTHFSGAAGAALGIVAGAWTLLRGIVAAERVEHQVVSGTVRTLTVEEAMAHPQNWTISVQLVVYYAVALAIFWGVHWGLKLSSESMGKDLRDGKAKALLLALGSALLLNFFGVGALVMLGQRSGVPIRIAMIIVPAFIVIESYVTMLRADRENRLGHWMGLLGSAGGIAGASWMLLKGAAWY